MLDIRLIFVSAAVIGTFIGAVWDFKYKWVPDYLNYFMIFFGIGGHLLWAVFEQKASIFIYSLGSAGILYIAAAALYYTGSWGGGDSKMLIGLGALLPAFNVLNLVEFIFTLWFNILIFGGIFSLLYIMYIFTKNYNTISKDVKNSIKNKYYYFGVSFIIPVLFYLFSLSNVLVVMGWFLGIFIVVLYLINNPIQKVMYKYITADKLVEGDWILHEVKAGKEILYKPRKTGIEQKEIDKILEYNKKGKISKLKIKDGMPYVPVIFFGLITTLYYGNLLLQGIL